MLFYCQALAVVTDKMKKGGGIRAYAESVGKGENAVKVSHLYEISKAPQHTWQLLTDLLTL